MRVRAFRINQHPFNLEQLGKYIPEESRVDESKLWKESKLTLAEARKLYPEWYQEKVVEKQGRKYWECNSALYEWWKEKIKEGATFHHRYFSIMCLAIYGVKCGLSYETVEQDAFSLVPFLNAINPEEPFTEEDCLSALECFDKKYCTFPIDDIVKISGIPIKKNKRNGRKQKEHLQAKCFKKEHGVGRPKINTCRYNRELALDYMRKNGEIKGRPKGSSKQKKLVEEWQKNHPDGKKAACVRDTGLSKPTVYKWWK